MTGAGTSSGPVPPEASCVRGGLSLDEPLLDAVEAAELLRVRVSWVQEAVRERVLPCIRVGRHLRFTRGMLEDWIDEHLDSQRVRRRGV
ncbi:MAG: helix-turn-helix domain-containing protein [Solirubrobacteraceae bacterium]